MIRDDIASQSYFKLMEMIKYAGEGCFNMFYINSRLNDRIIINVKRTFFPVSFFSMSVDLNLFKQLIGISEIPKA